MPRVRLMKVKRCKNKKAQKRLFLREQENDDLEHVRAVLEFDEQGCRSRREMKAACLACKAAYRTFFALSTSAASNLRIVLASLQSSNMNSLSNLLLRSSVPCARALTSCHRSRVAAVRVLSAQRSSLSTLTEQTSSHHHSWRSRFSSPVVLLGATAALAALVEHRRRGARAAEAAPAASASALSATEFRPVELVSVEQLTHDTARYRFKLAQETPFALPIASCVVVSLDGVVDEKGAPIVRPYTPVEGAPPGHMDLIIKSYENGKISKRMRALQVSSRSITQRLFLCTFAPRRLLVAPLHTIPT